MDVRLLGPLEVRLEEGPIELGPRKQRAVLAMLALEAGRTVSVDRLAEGLWGERAAGERAEDGPALRVASAARARRQRRRDRHARPRLRAAASPKAASTRCASSDCSRSRAPREALALWRGDALADVADEPFAAARDPPAGRAEAASRRAGDRRRPRGWPARRGDRRARRARRGESAARAAARPAHARAVPLRPAVRGARGATATRARGWWRRSASSPGAELQRLHERSSPMTRRSTCPPPTARARAAARPRRGGARARCSSVRRPCSSPASPRSASSACSSPTGCRGSTRTPSG